MNHYPLIGRKMYAECRELDPCGHIDPFGPITCPICRERLAMQSGAKLAGAVTQPDEKERRFFEANASSLASVLNQ